MICSGTVFCTRSRDLTDPGARIQFAHKQFHEGSKIAGSDRIANLM